MQHLRKLAAACRSFALYLVLSGFLRTQTPAEYHQHADKALQTFLLRFWDQRENYLRADQPADGRLTGYWTFAQGFDALLDGAERTRGEAYLGLVETFYRAQEARGWTAGYYDDESWMALNLFAEIQGPYQSSIPPNQFEAENATIRGLGLEAKYGSFTGWGYVAGWGSDGQEVDFQVRAPAKGPYQVTFRYAAGAGDAYRYVALNGATASGKMAFPGTGQWTSYSTASLRAELPAGPNRIAVVLSEAKGSSNYLNLDNVRLRPLATFFRRGDANGDGRQDLSDAVLVLSFLFLGEPGALACEKAGDANDDGANDLSDAVLVLGALFLGGDPPPEPSAACGADPTADSLGCGSHPPCN